MTDNIEVRYEKHQLENYIMDLLTLEACRLFLPAAFIKTEGEVIGSYRTEGYCRLSDLKEFDTEDILSIVLSLLAGIEDAQRHYIFPHEYVMDSESLFIQKGMRQTKAIFIREKKDIPLPDKIISLLEDLKEKGHEEGREYLEDAIAFIRQGSFGSKAVVHHLEKLRKEVYLCGVK